MIKRAGMALAASAAFLLAACAGMPGQTVSQPSAKVQSYVEHAGESVEGFSLFGHLNSWNSLSDDKLVVRTGVKEAWLLSVDSTCMNLEFAHRIALTTSLGNRVQTGFDYVRFDDGFQGQRCRITDIRPVDTEAAREALKAAG